MSIGRFFKFVKNIINTIEAVDFFLVVFMGYDSIQWSLIMDSKNNRSVVDTGSHNQWKIFLGSAYDFNQFYNIMTDLIHTIKKKYNITAIKIIILIGVPEIKFFNFHQKIGVNENLPAHSFNNEYYGVIHDCGKFYLIDGAMPVNSLENLLFHEADIYESYFGIHKGFYHQIMFQMDRLGIQWVNFGLSNYLLAKALSHQLKMDIVLINIEKYQTTVTINHKNFTYNYFHWDQGFFHITENNKVNKAVFDGFIKNIESILKHYSKSVVILSGYGSSIKINFYLQQLCNNKILYLNQLTNGESNHIFFNLIYYYNFIFELTPSKHFLEFMDEIEKWLI
jgi:predicted DNA-binding protein YlxM (UPF0122 family)